LEIFLLETQCFISCSVDGLIEPFVKQLNLILIFRSDVLLPFLFTETQISANVVIRSSVPSTTWLTFYVSMNYMLF